MHAYHSCRCNSVRICDACIQAGRAPEHVDVNRPIYMPNYVGCQQRCELCGNVKTLLSAHRDTTDFRVTRDGAKYVAHCTSNVEAVFCGEGGSIAEAIGNCVISNREKLDATFVLAFGDQPPMKSTYYGKPRP